MQMEYSHIKQSSGDRIFSVVNYAILLLFLLMVLYPLIYIVSASFSDPSAVIAGKVRLWPIHPTLAGYEAVFKHKLIWSSFRNTVFYTVFGTIINVVMTLLAAYPLSRKDCYGRNAVMMLFRRVDSKLPAGERPWHVEYGLGYANSRGPVRLECHYYEDLFPDHHSRRNAGSGAIGRLQRF
jgi:hypothetical protein